MTVTIRILCLAMLLLAAPVAAQTVVLYENDFSSTDLSDFAIGGTGCSDNASAWFVEDGKLVYDEGGCLDECTMLRYPNSSFNFTVEFDARVVRGDQFRMQLPFTPGDAGATVTVGDRLDGYNVCIRDVNTSNGGCYADGGDWIYAYDWNHYEVSFSYGVIRVVINGSERKVFDQHASIPPNGTFAFLPPGTPTCNTRLEIDNLSVQARAPEVELRVSSGGNPAPEGADVTLWATIRYAQTNNLYPVNHVFGPAGGTYQFTMGPDPITFGLHADNPQGSAVAQLTVHSADPEFQYFTAWPSAPYPGDATEITWAATSGDSIVIDGINVTTTDMEGSLTRWFDHPVTLRGDLWSGGVVVDQVWRGISPRLPQLTAWSVSDGLVVPGAQVTVSWNVTASDSVLIEPLGFVSTANFGGVETTITEPTDFVLRSFYNQHELVSDTLHVGIEPPVINAFVTSPSWVGPGEQTNLVWNVNYADSLRIEPLGVTVYDATGSVPHLPAGDETFVLHHWAGDYAATDTAHVYVRDMAIASFTANPSSVIVGESSLLSWEVTNPEAEVEFMDEAGMPVVGDRLVAPAFTTTYHLTARLDGLIRTASATVEVSGSPPGTNNIYLVPDPTDLSDRIPDPQVGQAFDVYAVSIQPEPLVIGGFAFRMELPSGLLLASTEYLTGGTNYAAAPDHLVLLSTCLPMPPSPVLARFTLLPLTPDVVDGSVTLTPEAVPLPYDRWGLTDCSQAEWVPFDHVRDLRLGGDIETAVEPGTGDAPPASDRLEMVGAAPNPFNPTTTVRFVMPHPGTARIRVVDGAGRVVRSDAVVAGAGEASWTWYGRHDDGRTAASGAYWVAVELEGKRATTRVTLLK